MTGALATLLALTLHVAPGAGEPSPGPGPGALAAVDGPEALWRLLGAEEGWPAAEVLRSGAPLGTLLAGLPRPEWLAWRRLTCQSGETVWGRAAFAATPAGNSREAARAAALVWEALAVRGPDGPAPVLLQALFARSEGRWRLVALGARPAGGGAPAFLDEARLEALRSALAAGGPRP